MICRCGTEQLRILGFDSRLPTPHPRLILILILILILSSSPISNLHRWAICTSTPLVDCGNPL